MAETHVLRNITHVVGPEQMRDLLGRAPRASIAFNNAGRVEIVPVELRFQEERYWIGISARGSGPVPGPDALVKLSVDEGMQYFDMRGIWIRGRASFSGERPEGAAPVLTWFELVPDKFLAWDFGTMRRRP